MEKTLDIEKFAEFVIEKWQVKIITLGIKGTRQLLHSFHMDIVRDTNGNPELIKFMFEHYGRFLDMGVFGSGNRTSKTEKKHYRKKQPWYTGTFRRQVWVLSALLARQYGYQSVTTVTEALKK